MSVSRRSILATVRNIEPPFTPIPPHPSSTLPFSHPFSASLLGSLQMATSMEDLIKSPVLIYCRRLPLAPPPELLGSPPPAAPILTLHLPPLYFHYSDYFKLYFKRIDKSLFFVFIFIMKKICIRETGGKRGWEKMRRGTRPGKFFNYKVIRMQGCFVFDIRLRSYFFFVLCVLRGVFSVNRSRKE